MRKLLIPLLLSIAHFTNGQEITKDFTKLLHDDQFGASSANNWEQAFNSDNLFLVQNGNYELFRKNRTSGYFVFSKQERLYESVEIKASLNFEKHNNKKQSAGLIIMTQTNLTGGLVLEISPKLGYRVQRVSSGGTTSITKGKDGWVKSKAVSSKGDNEIKIKTYLKVFDLYVNDEFLFTFSDIEYYKGGMGLFIGPNSKCRFHRLIVHGEEEIDLVNTVIKTKKQEDLSLTQIILKLRRTLNEKDKTIEELEDKLSSSQRNTYIDTATRRKNRELKKENVGLKNQKSSLESQLSGQKAELERLRKFKTEIEKSGEGDIVINLTNIISRQKSEIEKLTKENGYCKQELAQVNKRVESIDIELKRVSETNILIRELLYEKDSLLKEKELLIKKLKARKFIDEEQEEDKEEVEDKKEEKKKDKKEEDEVDKNELLNQLLEKEKRAREKEKERKKKEEDSDEDK